jgi:hypothetical protein
VVGQGSAAQQGAVLLAASAAALSPVLRPPLLKTRLGLQQVQQALLGPLLRSLRHPRLLLTLHQRDGLIHQVPHHALHVPAHIAHLGVLGGLHLHEGHPQKLGEPPGDLRLAHARGPDHQDVLGRDLVPDVPRHLHAPPAVAQRHRHGLLGLPLPDDVAVQILHQPPGRQAVAVVWLLVHGLLQVPA